MKLHTKLTPGEVDHALGNAQRAGHVPWDIHFTERGYGQSRSHARRYDIQLGTYDKGSLPPGAVDRRGKAMRVRKYQNRADTGAGSAWAATYDEWGWFLAEVFKMDPMAKTGPYTNGEDFHKQTEGRFRTLTENMASDGYRAVTTHAPYMGVYYIKEEATS